MNSGGQRSSGSDELGGRMAAEAMSGVWRGFREKGTRATLPMVQGTARASFAESRWLPARLCHKLSSIETLNPLLSLGHIPRDLYRYNSYY